MKIFTNMILDSQDKLEELKQKTNLENLSIYNRGADMFNNLSSLLERENSTAIFKKELKKLATTNSTCNYAKKIASWHQKTK